MKEKTNVVSCKSGYYDVSMTVFQRPYARRSGLIILKPAVTLWNMQNNEIFARTT